MGGIIFCSYERLSRFIKQLKTSMHMSTIFDFNEVVKIIV